MERKVGLTESARYTCLEGLDEASNFSSVSAINLDYCGWEKCSPGYQFGPYVREFFVIHIILDGKGYYRTPNGEFTLQKGDAFFIYPGEETTYWADKEDPWHYTWVGFHGIRSAELAEKMGFPKERPVLHVKQLDKMEQAIRRMLQAKQLTVVNEMRRMSELLYLFALFIEDNDAYQEDEEHQDYPSDVYGTAARDYMMVHYKEKIKIDDLAEHIGISRSHLTSSFKKKVGMSPQEFLINLRMEKAATRLKETADPINVVAAECGYEDSMSFSKAFKLRYSMSPKAYRESKLEIAWSGEKRVNQDKFPL